MMDAEELAFLNALIEVGGKTVRRGLPLSTPAQRKARQRCKDRKLVVFKSFQREGRHVSPAAKWIWMWGITAAGRRAVAAEDLKKA